jgi:hypothetical protein
VSLEIQVLINDLPAHHFLDIDPVAMDQLNGETVISVAQDLNAALPGIATFTPLMISLEYLFGLGIPSALGQEHFTVETRLTEPVRFPDRRLEGGPVRFDVVRLTSGDIDLSAIVPHGPTWPHVSVHGLRPRRTQLSPVLQRAFLAALRDAVRPLVTESAA